MKKSEREKYWRILTGMIKWTTPYRQEKDMEPFLPKGGIWDASDNYIITVGNGESKNLFCSHLDNATSEKKRVRWHYRNGIIHTTNNVILGADDKAGVLVMIAMIDKKVPGTYIFHAGEEKGTIGSTYIAKSDNFDLSKFNMAVSFDRRDICSVITRQSGGTCCSDEYGNFLCKHLHMKLDTGGTYTDTANYMYDINECTNISVGYMNEHRATETLNASWLIEVFIPNVLKIDWDKAPIVRDCKKAVTSWRYNTKIKGNAGYNNYYDDDYNNSSRYPYNGGYAAGNTYKYNAKKDGMTISQIKEIFKSVPEGNLLVDDANCIYVADKATTCELCNSIIQIGENVYLLDNKDNECICQKCAYTDIRKTDDKNNTYLESDVSSSPKRIWRVVGKILCQCKQDIIDDGETLNIYMHDDDIGAVMTEIATGLFSDIREAIKK
jgi:hypothetical protein